LKELRRAGFSRNYWTGRPVGTICKNDDYKIYPRSLRQRRSFENCSLKHLIFNAATHYSVP
jgi:hypothetical protein